MRKYVVLTNNTDKELTASYPPFSSENKAIVAPGDTMFIGLHSIAYTKYYAQLLAIGFTVDIVPSAVNQLIESPTEETVDNTYSSDDDEDDTTEEDGTDDSSDDSTEETTVEESDKEIPTNNDDKDEE